MVTIAESERIRAEARAAIKASQTTRLKVMQDRQVSEQERITREQLQSDPALRAERIEGVSSENRPK